MAQIKSAQKWFKLIIKILNASIAEWVRAAVLSHFEWMVLSSNPGGGRINIKADWGMQHKDCQINCV